MKDITYNPKNIRWTKWREYTHLTTCDKDVNWMAVNIAWNDAKEPSSLYFKKR